jgi:hypothetical protein
MSKLTDSYVDRADDSHVLLAVSSARTFLYQRLKVSHNII